MQLIDKVDVSGISCLTIEEGCLKISIKKAEGQTNAAILAAAAKRNSADDILEPRPNDTPADEAKSVITAPLAGTFYVSATPGGAPFVRPGSSIGCSLKMPVVWDMASLYLK